MSYRRACRSRMCRRTVGNLASPLSAIDGKVAMFTSVGTIATPPLDGRRDRVRGKPAGVLDAVDAGRDQVRQAVLAEAVRGDPGALLVRGGHRRDEDVGRPAGRQVAGVAVDPVAHQLDPAVAGPGLGADLLDQLLGLDLVRVVADVAAGAGDVPAGADDPRQVRLVVDPAGVRGAAGVADQQRARRRGRPRACARDVASSTAPCASRPTWQCASTRPGSTQPSTRTTSAPAADGCVEGQPTADHPGLLALVERPDEDRTGQVQHVVGHDAQP